MDNYENANSNISKSYLDNVYSRSEDLKKSSNLLKAFIEDPLVGSVIPSSISLCRTVLSQISSFQKRDIIELGAGTGTVTKYLVKNMDEGAKVYAFERNRSLMNALKKNIQDPRLISYNASAENLLTFRKNFDQTIGAIVSGIPFRFLDPMTIHSIIRQCRAVIDEEGSLIIYQTWLPLQGIYEPLKLALDKYFTLKNKQIVLCNVPPLYVATFAPIPR